MGSQTQVPWLSPKKKTVNNLNIRSESSLSISQKKEKRQAIRKHYQRKNQATTAPGILAAGADKGGVADSGALVMFKKENNK